ncbi:hypothetical protein TELCIR_12651, partial [Teladorsagia circumcincta]
TMRLPCLIFFLATVSTILAPSVLPNSEESSDRSERVKRQFGFGGGWGCWCPWSGMGCCNPCCGGWYGEWGGGGWGGGWWGGGFGTPFGGFFG